MELKGVELTGIDAPLASNVRARLSIEQLDAAQRADLSESRLSYYLRAAPMEVRRGLEPYGYYDVQVAPTLLRQGDQVTLRLSIRLGEPVQLRRRALPEKPVPTRVAGTLGALATGRRL